MAISGTEESPDNLGGIRAGATGKVPRPKACCIGDFQATPNVRYIRILEPDSCCEALKHQGAHLVGDWQLAVQRLPIQPTQIERQ